MAYPGFIILVIALYSCFSRRSCENVARPVGLEPTTSSFEGWHSIQLSYGRAFCEHCNTFCYTSRSHRVRRYALLSARTSKRSRACRARGPPVDAGGHGEIFRDEAEVRGGGHVRREGARQGPGPGVPAAARVGLSDPRLLQRWFPRICEFLVESIAPRLGPRA